jgi:hypothetical protein
MERRMLRDHTDSQRERLAELEDEIRERVLPDRKTSTRKKPGQGQERGDNGVAIEMKAEVRGEW